MDIDRRRSLKEDGFVVLRNAVPPNILRKARKLISELMPTRERRLLAPPELATDPRILNLFYGGNVDKVLSDLMGPYPPVISCQVAVTPAHDNLADTVGVHIDGGWSGELPRSTKEINPKTHRPKDPVKYFGIDDQKRGSNDGLLWMDPDRRISTGSYTALVGVCLSDQSVPGNGQFGVMKGLHEDVEAFFQRQRDAESIIGPEGQGWPRIQIDSSGRPFANGLPDDIRLIGAQLKESNPVIPNWVWRELTPVLMEPGDAVIALHSLPHTATPNMGPDPRINVYFRVRRLREANPHEGSRRIGHGVSDHPDRGYFGQFLDYPDSYDPWQTSIEKLCDHWSEWDGMAGEI
ncbi:MAG: hypothetical protein CMQ40_09925 [Gammaproteobacteria bacterium]|nr:hypothetical protein [Gammaproteobacteria bacterium]